MCRTKLKSYPHHLLWSKGHKTCNVFSSPSFETQQEGLEYQRKLTKTQFPSTIGRYQQML